MQLKTNPTKLNKYFLKSIYVLSFLISIVIISRFNSDLLGAKITQWFGIIAFVLLYLVMLIGAIYKVFSNLPFRNITLQSRKALGISTFYFALLHGFFGFFRFVGGFQGLSYWSSKYNYSLSLGLIALTILAVLTVTSNQYFIQKLGNNWKKLQKTTYVAGLLAVVHAMTITVHISNFTIIAVIGYILLMLLLALESIRLENFIYEKYNLKPKYLVTRVGLPLMSLAFYWLFFLTNHHSH